MDSHPSVSPSHCSTEPFHPTHYSTAVIFVAKYWLAFLGWSVMFNTIKTLQWLFLTPFWLAKVLASIPIAFDSLGFVKGMQNCK